MQLDRIATKTVNTMNVRPLAKCCCACCQMLQKLYIYYISPYITYHLILCTCKIAPACCLQKRALKANALVQEPQAWQSRKTGTRPSRRKNKAVSSLGHILNGNLALLLEPLRLQRMKRTPQGDATRYSIFHLIVHQLPMLCSCSCSEQNDHSAFQLHKGKLPDNSLLAMSQFQGMITSLAIDPFHLSLCAPRKTVTESKICLYTVIENSQKFTPAMRTNYMVALKDLRLSQPQSQPTPALLFEKLFSS